MGYDDNCSIINRELTVCICTLNEEQNITCCIEAIKEAFGGKIIVVDGNSGDLTAEIASNLGCEVISTPIRNLSHQRNLAINSVQTKFISFFDADDRPSSECISKMFHEIKTKNASAVMAVNISYENTTYWQKAMDKSLNINLPQLGRTNMIGQPSMFLNQDVVDIQYDESFKSHEDTFISRKLELNGKHMYLCDAINYRIHDKYFHDYLRKVKNYGAGDAKFIQTFPERRSGMFYHLLINYPFLKSWQLVKRGDVIYVPFMMFMGFGRFYYMLVNLLKTRES